MVGFIDVGGSLRGIYTSGVYDYLMDKNIKPEYAIGVSSGSANLTAYVANERGRTARFYSEYLYENKAFGLPSLLTTGSLINIKYIYSDISKSTGKDPLDFDGLINSDSKFTIVSTVAKTGKPHYFDKSEMKRDDYSILCAASSMPILCRPVKIDGTLYCDGGVSDPIPYKKAFEDGCDRIVLCITKPVDFRKTKLTSIAKAFIPQYPDIAALLMNMHEKYNNGVEAVMELEKQGKALIIAPDDCCGVDTAKKNYEGSLRLYEKGYKDAEKIERFLYSKI